MSKLYQSLGCPYCYSHNIDARNLNLDEKIEHYNYFTDSYPVVKTTRKRISKCKCLECGHTYSIDNGKDTYIRFEEPYPIENTDNTKLLAIYHSESGVSYKVVSVADTYRIYFAEGENFIEINNEDVQEILSNQEMAKKLVFNKRKR